MLVCCPLSLILLSPSPVPNSESHYPDFRSPFPILSSSVPQLLLLCLSSSVSLPRCSFSCSLHTPHCLLSFWYLLSLSPFLHLFPLIVIILHPLFSGSVGSTFFSLSAIPLSPVFYFPFLLSHGRKVSKYSKILLSSHVGPPVFRLFTSFFPNFLLLWWLLGKFSLELMSCWRP